MDRFAGAGWRLSEIMFDSAMAVKFNVLVFVAFSLLILPDIARAEARSCPDRPAILALSDRLLDDLDSKDPGFARYYARDAAYLKLHYGAMSEADADRMFARILAKKANASLGFVYAYYISRYGFDTATQKIGQANLAFYKDQPYDLTLIRALTLAGKFQLVLENLKRNGNVKGAPYALPVALPLIDQPPADRQRLADIADKAGVPFLAGGLYASLPSYETWPGFLKRNYEDVGYKGSRSYYIAFSGYHFSSLPLPDPRNGINGLQFRQMLQNIVGASWLTPQSALLYQFVVSSRLSLTYGKRAAMSLKEAYDQGRLRPRDTMDKGWLMTYRALADASGDPALIVRKMHQVHIASRHYLGADAGGILDTMLAAEAIGPWLKGQTKAFPGLPALASDRLKASWPTWQKLAEAIKNGGPPGGLATDEPARGMAAELLYAKGDWLSLLKLVAGEQNPSFRQRLEADFMARYDRLCDGSLYFPGDGLFLRNSTIHRFDMQTQ
jgi:hypothetical protein